MKKLYVSSLVSPGLLTGQAFLYNHTISLTPKFNFMYKFTQRIFLFLILGMITANSFAQSNTLTSGKYKQNFDAIGDNANTTLPTGWRADVTSGLTAVGSYASAQTNTDRRAGASMNSANNSGIYNFGAGTTVQGNGDRAIGGVTDGSSDKSINVYFDLLNSGASTISEVTVAYSTEKYRNGSNPDGYSVKLYYSTNGTAWTPAPASTEVKYHFDANDNGVNPAPDASQTKYVTADLAGLSIASGAHLYLAWNISTTSTVAGSNAVKSMALGIDDIKITNVTGIGAGPVTPMYFRSVNSGTWDNTPANGATSTTWVWSPDNGFPTAFTAATRAPLASDYTITILSGHTVTVTAPAITDQTTIDAGGTLTIAPNITLTLTDGQGFDLNVNGDLINNGHLLIRSENTNQSDIGTASIGPVTGHITGTGDVTVQRYISAPFARSAWRLLNAPLQTKTGISNSIYDNWQTMGAPATENGMTVSGPGYNGGANGLDYFSNAPSMKYWNGTAYVGVTDTKLTSLYSNPWFTFIRGDRTKTTYGSAGQTLLAATGSLNVGPVPVATSTTNDAFTMVGNPYASAIDLLTFNTDNSGSNIKSNYYYWDPYLAGAWSVGGYVTVSIDNLNNVTIVPEAATSPIGYATAPGDETRFLQSGQAMFVQTRSSGGGGAASVTFNENQKSYNVANNIFRETGAQPGKITVNLNVVSAGSTTLLDAAVAAFHSTYSDLINDYDAAKLLNVGESISIMRNGKEFSIERRQGIISDGIINLNLTALKVNTTYQLEIKASVNAAGLNAFLVDSYLKTTTPVDLSKTTTVNFTINGDAASTGANRFYISFAKPALVTAAKDGMSVFPNPVTNGVINLQMNNMAAGIYAIRVINGMGQVILNRQINHAAGSSSEAIYLGKGAVKGIYQLEVIKPDNARFSTKVIAN